jgi:two-component system chemotaxis response regulator CheY
MKSVLVVDDAISLRAHNIDILKALGFTKISEAINGQDAYGQVKAKMPDIITLDWNMPVMDGLAFLKALRQLPNGKHPKVIFCTSEGRSHKIQMAMDAGADEYIVKPVDLLTMHEKLQVLGFLE